MLPLNENLSQGGLLKDIRKGGKGEVSSAKDQNLGRVMAAALKIPTVGIWMAFLSSLFLHAGQAPQGNSACFAVPIPYEEVPPIVMALKEAAPVELRTNQPEAMVKAWRMWAARHMAGMQARMTRGDEDLLGNFIIFGTSFTSQPRLIQRDLAPTTGSPSAVSGAGSRPRQVLDARLDDFIRALETPGTNHRLVYLRRLLERKGHSLAGTAGRAKLRQYLVANLQRMLMEQQGFAQAVEEAQRTGTPGAELAVRSTIYRTRGLSVDTALFPNYAVEETLRALRSRGFLNSVDRVAVIGAGLDFADKREGYDFYPEQSVQPFALMDSLLRLGLSQAGNLVLTAMDVSPQVNSHLAAARWRAQSGAPYVVQLPRNLDSSWKPGTIAYWEEFGSRIGSPSKASAFPPNVGRLGIRAVSIRPEVVLSASPCAMDIVLQRLNLSETLKYDLIVATNILVYYDAFQQSLALANIARMLKPGGFLLLNAMIDLPGSRLKPVDYLTVVYSDDRPDDADNIVWYQRASDMNRPGDER